MNVMNLPPVRQIALLMASAFFMENLDATVIVTALPQMAQSFGVEAVDVNIGITAYVLTVAAFIPISGWMAERFGHRRVFSAAVTLFTLSSVLCALANTLWLFTGARLVQGLAGAMMVPVGRLVVLNNTPKDDLVKAIAYLTWPGLMAPVLGPPLGGFITTYASWHWIFLLNVPLGLLVLWFTQRLVPASVLKHSSVVPFDIKGFLLSTLACLGVLYGLEKIGQNAANWQLPMLLLATGTVLVLALLRHARRHPAPLLRFDSFYLRTYTVSILGGSIFRAMVSAMPFVLPLMFQLAFGYDAFTAGLLVLTLFAGNIGMKPMTGWVLRRYGFRQSLVISILILASTMFTCMLFTPTTSWLLMLPVLVISGMARSMGFTVYATMAFSEVPKERMTAANTLFSMMQQFSFGLGVAVAAILLRVGEALGDASQPLAHFRFAWGAIGLLTLLALLDVLRLPANAGATVSGHSQIRRKA